MTLQSSGAISLANVQTEFGGANPIGINEYYGVAAGVPASGTISLANFYGKSAAGAFAFNEFVFGKSSVFYGNPQTHNYSGNIVTPGAGNSPKTFTVNLGNNIGGGGYNGANVTLRYYQGGALTNTWYENRAGIFGIFHTFTFGSSTMQFTSTIYDDNIYSNVGGRALVYTPPTQGNSSGALYLHESGYGIQGLYYYGYD